MRKNIEEIVKKKPKGLSARERQVSLFVFNYIMSKLDVKELWKYIEMSIETTSPDRKKWRKQ